MTTPRLLLLHKQKTSGRTRFLRLPAGVVCFDPLPELSSLRDEGQGAAVLPHPAAVVKEAEAKLGLNPGDIEPEGEFHCWVDTPEGDVAVLMGGFTTIDPPFAAAEALGGKFIQLTEARGLSPVELAILRRAYEYVLG